MSSHVFNGISIQKKNNKKRNKRNNKKGNKGRKNQNYGNQGDSSVVFIKKSPKKPENVLGCSFN